MRLLLYGLLTGLVLLAVAPARADLAAGIEAFHLGRGTQAMGTIAPLAEEGDPAAQYWLGRLHDEGLGTAQDKRIAETWFRKAADAGHTEAQRVLGIYRSEGLGGLERDDDLAFGWYRRAADAGNVKAMRNLANMFLAGRGTRQDFSTAALWFQRAADAGNAKAGRALGYLYYFGRGVPQDRNRAARLFARAADEGDERAGVNLGFVHYHGNGVPQDFAIAREQFEKAAQKGNAEAQLFLARMALLGEGGPVDPARSFYWALLARIQKPEHAAWYFDQLRDKLSAAEKAAIRKEVSSWVPLD